MSEVYTSPLYGEVLRRWKTTPAKLRSSIYAATKTGSDVFVYFDPAKKGIIWATFPNGTGELIGGTYEEFQEYEKQR